MYHFSVNSQYYTVLLVQYLFLFYIYLFIHQEEFSQVSRDRYIK